MKEKNKFIGYNNQEIIYNYDATHLNRLISMKERLFGDDYMTYYTYDDSDGFPLRVHSVTYPTGYATCNVYDLASGQHYKIEDGQNNTLWETLEMNALGQVTRYSLGNGVMSHRSFDPNTGRLHGIGSSNGQINLQNLGYEWDDFGNLAARYDKTKDLMETFGYDALDRLTDISLNDVPTGHMTYDIFGRMTSKQADGQAVFSSAQYDFVGLDGQLRPHAVSSAVVGSNPFPTQGLGLDYTMFDKVLQITWPSNNSIQFDYGYDHQRIRSLTSHGLSPITKTYIGNCEKIHALPISDVYRTYLNGPLGVFAVVEQVANTESITYILKDHLGSWTVFTDEDGDLIREESFDAWGNRRNAATWTGAAIGDLLFDRGFTGHEHIENIGLINMNGRLYDPVMSTFLSVDNYVQEPDFSQNFNRYAYCLNNPLKYVDPDGESITLLTAIAISAAVSMVSTVATNIVYDRPLYEGLGKAAVVGALQGVFSFGIGTAAGIIGEAVKGVSNATWGMVAQAGFQVLAHGTLGGISTEARGGKFWHGFASGAVASFVSTITGVSCKEFHVPDSWTKAAMVAAGGLSGGVSASMAGGDFWEGMCNGLICSGLNHAMHLACGPDDPPGSGSANNKKNETTKQTFTNVGEAGGGIATAVDGAASKATMKTLSLTSKVLGGAFVVVSEIPDLLIAWNDPSLGNVTKVVVGSVLGAATVFAGPVVATGAFVLGVVNAYGGFDEGYDYLNNMKTNNR